LAAVKKLGSSIRFIENPSEKVQLAAVEQDPSEWVKQLTRSKGY